MRTFKDFSDKELADLLGDQFDRHKETDSWCPIHQCKKHQKTIGSNRVIYICYECYKLDVAKLVYFWGI
jgi:hypothetical protein